jgi:lysyl oxidase
MGANLVPGVRNFYITHETFDPNSGDVLDACVLANQSYKLLRFDFLSQNVGDHEFNLGRPVDRPDLFVYSQAHGHYHMKEFNKYTLIDGKGTLAIPSKKPGFCLVDVEKISSNPGPRKFVSCAQTAEMGVSAGWADVYRADIGCQYLIIDGVPDGDYTLVCTTNTAHAADKNGVPEDTYTDNTTSVCLRIAGDKVIELPWLTRIPIVALAHELNPGWLLELWLAIHGGDPGPQEARLKEAEELMQRATSIVRELAGLKSGEVVSPPSRH